MNDQNDNAGIDPASLEALEKKAALQPGIQDQIKSEGISREMSFGEKLVGLTFNPSNDDKVGKAKRLCAELADLLNDDNNQRHYARTGTHLTERLFDHAIGEILNAKMNVVNVLTLKY